ncbi:MAG: hypothetical protein QOD07_2579 [Frankiaceae bacterium]|jgi:hypothetical protein|nr:hypothetical protein [Frankiaceae bacterium]
MKGKAWGGTQPTLIKLTAKQSQSLPSVKAYKELKKGWFDVGEKVGQTVGLDPPKSPQPHKYVQKLVTSGKGEKQLGDTWRGIDPGKDEHLPTSAVVSLTLGVRKALQVAPGSSLPAPQTDELNVEYHAMSSLRSQTSHTGYRRDAVNGMQHPTGANPMWQTRQGLHNLHDRARSEAALQAAQAETSKPKASPRSILRPAGRAAGTYTFNEMYAPPTAANMNPQSPIDAAKAQEMLEERERGKEHLVKNFGASRDPNPNSVNPDLQTQQDNWQGGQFPRLQRRLSAARLNAQQLATLRQNVATV